MNILYFGCMHEAGHYLCDKTDYLRRYESTPWGTGLDDCPQGHNGVARVLRKDGWTSVGFTDNSVDTRPGSHSVFLVDKDIPAAELLEAAKIVWPEVFARFRFKIVLPEEPKP
jgi:hypothetical protein